MYVCMYVCMYVYCKSFMFKCRYSCVRIYIQMYMLVHLFRCKDRESERRAVYCHTGCGLPVILIWVQNILTEAVAAVDHVSMELRPVRESFGDII